MNLGLIGYGTIARQMLLALREHVNRPFGVITCLARPDGVERARDMLTICDSRLAARTRIVTHIDAFLKGPDAPDLVAEMAGHDALHAAGVGVLESSIDLAVTSVGALADSALHVELQAAAGRSGARLLICPGAIGGLDILAAAKLSGLGEVTYVSRKPPVAWAGTPGTSLMDLSRLAQPATIFEGNARAAALLYPQNANVAATLALHGAGFENTRVRLVADPHVLRNVHEIAFTSATANVTMSIVGQPAPGNPKSSMTPGFALAHMILEQCGPARALPKG